MSRHDSSPTFDLSLSRLVDGVATRSDIHNIDAEEAARPGAWREVALAQKLNTALITDLRPLAAKADAVSLQPASILSPTDQPAPRIIQHDPAAERFSRRLRLGAAWGGWAVAAVVAIAVRLPNTTGNTNTGNTASMPILSAAEALTNYLSKGRNEGSVIGELPKKVLVNTTQAPDGQGYEVIFIRQIMERVRVDDLYRYSSDELGNPTPIKVQLVKPVRPAM
ncbi:MAG: hypothetical protein PSX37_00945 [bacterium]|nr:hypothetical protein [bacterium]